MKPVNDYNPGVMKPIGPEGREPRKPGRPWRMVRPGVRLLPLILVAGLTGCAAFRGPSPGIEYSGTTLGLDSLVSVVNRRAFSLHSVRGSGDLRIRTAESGRTRKVDVSLAAERPDRLRLQGRVGALVSIFDFLARTDSLMLYLPRDRAVVLEDPESSRGLPLLASRELVLALLQEPVDVPALKDSGEFRAIPEGYEVTLRTVDAGGRRTTRHLIFESRNLKLVHQNVERTDASGDVRRARIRYARHVWTGSQWFPGEVHLELGDGTESLDLKFIKFEANPAIDAKFFTLRIPPGTRRVEAAELNEDFLNEAPGD